MDFGVDYVNVKKKDNLIYSKSALADFVVDPQQIPRTINFHCRFVMDFDFPH